MRDWVCNWKMLFNPDPTKQAKEVFFSGIPCTHPSLFFNNSLIELAATLGLTLDQKLTFQYHVNENIKNPLKELVFFVNYSLFNLEHPY